MNKIIYPLLLLVCLSTSLLKAQSLDNSNLVQISGVVLTSDSLDKVSFANIIAKNSRHGTISDYFGYFSFVAQKGDTIQFSALGYRKAIFVIPDTLTSNKYSLIKIMEPEIYELDEAIIFP
jgi:hypothetical protein